MRHLGKFVVLLLAISQTEQTAAVDSAEFKNRPLAVGESVTQEVDFGLKMKIMASTGTEATRANKNLQRRQHRELQLLAAPPGGARAKLRFDLAEQTQQYGPGVATRLKEPVADKSYLVSRQDDKLTVTNLDGSAVPQEEEMLVAASMEAFGRANPLSQFLNGQRVAVGEQLEPPANVAEELFAAWREMIEITRFTLTLERIDETAASPLAVFTAVIEGQSRGAKQHLTILQGRMLIECDTCRPALVELSGPVRLCQTQSTNEGDIELDCQGSVYAVMRNIPPGAKPVHPSPRGPVDVTTRPGARRLK
ncbi:MAG: hypothetical protein K1X71_08505 [Pirellulales bacterium]|nr:hypothetical protein [Pirellulales bacterium]